MVPGRYLVLEPTVWYSHGPAITFMERIMLPKAKVLSMAVSMLKMSGKGRGASHSTMIGDISERLFPTTPLVCVEAGNMPTAIMKDTGIAPMTAIGMAPSKG